ncbi:MAG: hypothetical protein CRN43_02490 [Candidatus Nephrothrix sp. EaCA]|nr:MAG: hypothetical protein CRN43_02490 [Candidatus Nephrothrix sp. EaCA]
MFFCSRAGRLGALERLGLGKCRAFNDIIFFQRRRTLSLPAARSKRFKLPSFSKAFNYGLFWHKINNCKKKFIFGQNSPWFNPRLRLLPHFVKKKNACGFWKILLLPLPLK